uniref:Ubiquitin-like protease family profile domain-containing protein n=1 Tax=Brassica campestris TaxID=3711 RepID=A0A3P6CX78_BRACM|nr:unnamed protein product [Brassica rapa]
MSEHVCFVYIVWILYMYFVSCLKTLIGYYCLKWIFGYYCTNPSCILHSESVNGTNAGRKSLPEDKGPDVPTDASSSKDKAPEPSLVLLEKNQPTVSDLQKEDARYQEKRDAALALFRAKSDRTRKLAASQQSPYTANSTAKVIIPNKKLYPGYSPFASIDKKKLKELADWLKTSDCFSTFCVCCHYRTPLDKKPRTSITWWYHILQTSLEWLEDCHIDAWINVLRKRYDANPQHFRSERMHYTIILPIEQGLGTDIDDVYAPVNYTDSHWIAMWISIPKRYIVVWDSICSSISPEELDVYFELKKDFAKPNEKTMRDKMAVDIFKELPDAHEFENKDNDANLGAYKG